MRDNPNHLHEEFHLVYLDGALCDRRDEIYSKHRCAVGDIRTSTDTRVLRANYRPAISVHDSKCSVLIPLKTHVLPPSEKKTDLLKCKVSTG